MKPPAWLKISAPYMVDNKAFVDVEIRERHPAFLWMIWGMMRKEIRRGGGNPNDPRVLAFMAYHLVKIFIEAG